jgi:uncharacterized membrane protein YdbT with pleckstrin-like domain
MMSSYVEQTLTKGETVMLTTRIALQRYWFRFGIGGLLLVTAATGGVASGSPSVILMDLGLAALLIGPPIIRYLTNELALTNKRVVAKTGLLSLRTIEIALEKIESLRVEQSIFGRILGYGTVMVVGTGGSRELIPDIPNPIIFRTNFAAALETRNTPAPA